jgi:hypothetical protein
MSDSSNLLSNEEKAALFKKICEEAFIPELDYLKNNIRRLLNEFFDELEYDFLSMIKNDSASPSWFPNMTEVTLIDRGERFIPSESTNFDTKVIQGPFEVKIKVDRVFSLDLPEKNIDNKAYTKIEKIPFKILFLNNQEYEGYIQTDGGILVSKGFIEKDEEFKIELSDEKFSDISLQILRLCEEHRRLKILKRVF